MFHSILGLLGIIYIISFNWTIFSGLYKSNCDYSNAIYYITILGIVFSFIILAIELAISYCFCYAYQNSFNDSTVTTPITYGSYQKRNIIL